ncbi:hypothetical protein QYE76_070579 [Lolium multiflorum]|uniref:Reverse transcriptase Ty1/copia-type domain-containing protein n=1 Tax=Lolium multiflorum TaxID=4521 RepID=A0AAD8WG00_LOLMU|nr:hypothetical protein QYE76_070579 [Lolium multiflorum]
MASSINFNQFLEKEKLKSNGSNFTDWFHHVRIFLSGGNLQFVLDAPLGDPPAETETDEVKAVYATRKTRYSQVQCAILCSLESDLQKRFEHHDPHELMNELKAIFETHAAVECYEASKHFFSCMMEEGSSVSEHMLAMTGHAKKLSDLGIVIPNRLGINRVLQSLPPSYKNFVMNYNMQNMNKELPELFGMLKAAEIEIKKEHQVLMVNKTTSFKKQGKSKGKFKKGGKKAATPPVKPKNGPKPDAECYCKEKGHWKRNCSKYRLIEERPCQEEERRSEGKIFVAKNGAFLEKEFLTKEVTGRKVELDEIDESILVDQSSAVPEVVPVPPTPATEEANDNDHETSNEETTEPRRSTRERTTPDWYDPCLNVMIVDNNDEDPATYEEAMMSPDSNKWQEAMKSEMGSMYDNKVWTLVDLPDSRKAVENKWIFKRKTDADGNITVYKARLVAKGFRQIQGVDYDETFSPVAKLKSVRILLAIAAFFDYEIWQMDVKMAFLNGDIEEELYMVQPKGFVNPKNADKRSSAGLLHHHRHHAVVFEFKRSYYFRCPLEREVDVVFINNRTCDRVRRCCPFVAPEPIVIKIFYALLQAASDRLPQQQEPPLVGFGISSRPLPAKEGNEERKKKKKKKKKGNKEKEVTAYPRVYEITTGNRKYVAPDDYYDNESEYNDLLMPFTYISDHDLNEHTTFDIGNLWETNSENDDVNNCHSISTIHASSHNDIESSKLGDEVFENPFATDHYMFDTSPSSNNDGDEKHIQSSRLSAYANAHAMEVATAVFLNSIFKRDHRIGHARPAIDAATASDDSTILRESITLHLSRETTTPCRGDTTTPTQQKHTAPPQHHRHPLSAPKTMPPTGRTALRAAIV